MPFFTKVSESTLAVSKCFYKNLVKKFGKFPYNMALEENVQAKSLIKYKRFLHNNSKINLIEGGEFSFRPEKLFKAFQLLGFL